MTRRPGLLSAHHWLAKDRCAAEARKTKVTGWGALNGLPNCLDPAYPQKTAFRFPPRLSLGGSYLGMSRREPT